MVTTAVQEKVWNVCKMNVTHSGTGPVFWLEQRSDTEVADLVVYRCHICYVLRCTYSCILCKRHTQTSTRSTETDDLPSRHKYRTNHCQRRARSGLGFADEISQLSSSTRISFPSDHFFEKEASKQEFLGMTCIFCDWRVQCNK